MKLLVLLLLPCLSLSEVSPGFTKCNQFFLNNDPPQFTPPSSIKVIPVRYICQCLRDNNDKQKYLYATLYNTDWRIPIYSAYVFKSAKVDRSNPWYIEPQLDDAKAEAWMAPEAGIQNIGYNQAMNSDYIGSDKFGIGYHKGHLYPVQHTDNHLSMRATSTLTNAAPQDKSFNQGKWSQHEAAVIADLRDCDSNVEAYVVTGVVPDHNIPPLKKRVTVSKYYWRATCCLKNGVFTGKGYFGPNNNKVVQTLSITELQIKLATDYRVTNIVIFPGVPKPTGPKRPRVVDPCY